MVKTARATPDAPEGEQTAEQPQAQEQPLPTVLIAKPRAAPRATRYVCLDFETNGFPGKASAPREDWTLPWSSFPIQLSVDFVEHGDVIHAMDEVIRGATQLSPWVRNNVPVTLKDIAERGVNFMDAVKQLAGMLREGDMIVAHNAQFDMETVLARTTKKLSDLYDLAYLDDFPAVRAILEAPRFCTMRCAYSQTTVGKQPSMGQLCEHFQVSLVGAHDARADSAALAHCVAEAWRRGVML